MTWNNYSWGSAPEEVPELPAEKFVQNVNNEEDDFEIPKCPMHGDDDMKFAGGPIDSPLRGTNVWYCTHGWDGEFGRCAYRLTIPWKNSDG
jgi:hypothetical protein